MQCKYEGLSGRCPRSVWKKSKKGYCVLHEPFDEKSDEEIEELKKAKLDVFYKEINEGKTNFEGCILPNIELSGKKLNGLNFQDVVIEEAKFTETIFEKEAIFDRTEFNGDTWFDRAIFNGEAKFNEVEFNSDVSFKDAKFNSNVSFEDVRFNQYTSFVGTTFKEVAIFNGAEFDSVSFYNSKFSKDVLFEDATFRSLAYFEGEENQVFHSKVDFGYAAFEKPKDVEFVKVNLSKARFINANIEEVRFVDVEWNSKGRLFKRKAVYDEILIDKGEYTEKDYELVADIYRRLRASYESRLQYPYAGDFYIGEMEMRRRNAKLFGRRVKNKILRFFIQNFSLTAFYKYFSLYGENYWLPLVWIFLTIILFGYVLSLMGIPNPWGASAFTFFQMPPKYVETLFEFSFWLSMAVLLERLAGVLFTVLFVLALRRKFKKTEE